MLSLPIKLENEPLIDAVFELRFTGEPAASEIIPGLLFNTLEGEVRVERLPVSEIPHPMREQDPNLRFAPLIRLVWGDFFISIGDRMISIGCKLPYQGWKDSFKPTIFNVLESLKKFETIKVVERYSIKYVNLIEAGSLKQQHEKLQLKMQLGGSETKGEHFTLKVERHEKNMVHIISVLVGATANIPNIGEKKGVVIDIDTVVQADEKPFSEWMLSLENEVETVRDANKSIFFSCITKEALEEMGPSYE